MLVKGATGSKDLRFTYTSTKWIQGYENTSTYKGILYSFALEDPQDMDTYVD